jgi:hypothetical protein
MKKTAWRVEHGLRQKGQREGMTEIISACLSRVSARDVGHPFGKDLELVSHRRNTDVVLGVVPKKPTSTKLFFSRNYFRYIVPMNLA